MGSSASASASHFGHRIVVTCPTPNPITGVGVGGRISEFSLENEVIKSKWRIMWENSAPTLRPLPDHVIVFNWGFWATSWENSAPTLWPLPDHVIVFNGLGDVVGEFRTNVVAVAGSCDCVQQFGRRRGRILHQRCGHCRIM